MRKSRGERVSSGSLVLALSAALVLLASPSIAGNDGADIDVGTLPAANAAVPQGPGPTAASREPGSLADDSTVEAPPPLPGPPTDPAPSTVTSAQAAVSTTELDLESLLVLAQRDVAALGPLSIGTLLRPDIRPSSVKRAAAILVPPTSIPPQYRLSARRFNSSSPYFSKSTTQASPGPRLLVRCTRPSLN